MVITAAIYIARAAPSTWRQALELRASRNGDWESSDSEMEICIIAIRYVPALLFYSIAIRHEPLLSYMLNGSAG